MTVNEIYETYGIEPAHYDANESHFAFTKRILGSSQVTVENNGVSYSSSSTNKGNTDNNNSLYSY